MRSQKAAIGSLLLSLALTVMGCAYAGVGVTPEGKAIVARNDAFLLGALRKVYVCQVTPNGLSDCKSKENP